MMSQRVLSASRDKLLVQVVWEERVQQKLELWIMMVSNNRTPLLHYNILHFLTAVYIALQWNQCHDSHCQAYFLSSIILSH